MAQYGGYTFGGNTYGGNRFGGNTYGGARYGALSAVDPIANPGAPPQGVQIMLPDGSVMTTNGGLASEAAATAAKAGLPVKRGGKRPPITPTGDAAINPNSGFDDMTGALANAPASVGDFLSNMYDKARAQTASLLNPATSAGSASAAEPATYPSPQTGSETAADARSGPSDYLSMPGATAPIIAGSRPRHSGKSGAAAPGSAPIGPGGGAPPAAGGAAADAGAPAPFDAAKVFSDLYKGLGSATPNTDLSEQEQKDLLLQAGLGMLAGRGNFGQVLGQAGLGALQTKRQLKAQKTEQFYLDRREKVDLAKHVTDLAVKDADYKLNVWKTQGEMARYGRQDQIDVLKVQEDARHNQAMEGAARTQANAAVIRAKNSGQSPQKLDEDFSRSRDEYSRQNEENKRTNARNQSYNPAAPLVPEIDPDIEAAKSNPSSPTGRALLRMEVSKIQRDLAEGLAKLKKDGADLEHDPTARAITEEAQRELRDIQSRVPDILAGEGDDEDPAIAE